MVVDGKLGDAGARASFTYKHATPAGLMTRPAGYLVKDNPCITLGWSLKPAPPAAGSMVGVAGLLGLDSLFVNATLLGHHPIHPREHRI